MDDLIDIAMKACLQEYELRAVTLKSRRNITLPRCHIVEIKIQFNRTILTLFTLT